MFNSNTPISTYSHLRLLSIIWSCDHTAYKLKPRSFYKSTHLWVYFADFHPGVNSVWQYYQTPKSAVTSEQFYLLIQLYNPYFKFKIAFFHCNSSTPVPLLGTSFNTISCFSDQIAYPPNVPQHSRRIHQRGCLSLRSPSSTIQSSQTFLPVSRPSIIPVDNDPNWENAPTTNPITNLIANRPTSSTCSQSKPCRSNNTNEQLAKVLGQLANTLNSSQTSSPNTNTRETKAHIPNTFSGTEPDKLNNFLFQCYLYFHANLAQFDKDIAKINFAMTYLTGVA